MEEIVKIVADYYNIFYKRIYEKTRKEEIRKARQIAMYLIAYKYPEKKPRVIAEHFGFDRATVLHSCKTVENDMFFLNSLSSDIYVMKQSLVNLNITNCENSKFEIKRIKTKTKAKNNDNAR